MDYYSNQMSKLIEELSCLPGIGAKSAARLAFHVRNNNGGDQFELGLIILERIMEYKWS